jgi:phosphoserine aminotransferase
MNIYKPLNSIFKPSVSYFSGYSIMHYDKEFPLLNVSPGPASISENIFKKLYDDIYSKNKYSYGNTPLEMSHRSPEYLEILNNVNLKIKNFMEIPNQFKILWTQGGGHGQFSAIPLNMKRINKNIKGGYLVSGTWSSRAFIESKKFINSENLLQNFYKNLTSIEYDRLPAQISIPSDIDYLYLCSNETVNGIEFKKNGIEYPGRNVLGKTKLIVDMSSDFLMKKVDWSNIDVAFACTSKNMGVAGANIVIIREDLIDSLSDNHSTPCTLDWKLYAETNSLYNTPAVFNIYLLNHIMDDYINTMKTIENVNDISKEKANILYEFLDNNQIFKPVVKDKECRSNINIPFIVGDGNEKMMEDFLEYCSKENLVGLRTQTPFSYKKLNLKEPLRISLYNGISVADVKHIVAIMKNFTLIYFK